MPAFVLNVAPVTLGAYTSTTPENSFDEMSLIQDQSFSNIRSVIFLGLDNSKSPKLCREAPGSDLCATGKGFYHKPAIITSYAQDKNVAYDIVVPGGNVTSGGTAEPYGRYDWFVKYGNETPINIGGYTTVPDNREFEYKWTCSSHFVMVKSEMPWDKYASITVPKNEACSLDYRKKHLGQVVAGGGAVGSYNPIFKDME